MTVAKRLSISDANPDGETKRLIKEIEYVLKAQTGVVFRNLILGVQ